MLFLFDVRVYGLFVVVRFVVSCSSVLVLVCMSSLMSLLVVVYCQLLSFVCCLCLMWLFCFLFFSLDFVPCCGVCCCLFDA